MAIAINPGNPKIKIAPATKISKFFEWLILRPVASSQIKAGIAPISARQNVMNHGEKSAIAKRVIGRVPEKMAMPNAPNRKALVMSFCSRVDWFSMTSG